MRPRLSVTRSAVELIKAFEGFRSKSARLDDGRWTIGYGHTLTAREGAEITEPEAEALLMYDLIQSSHAVNEHVFAPLTQNQFDALVSFVFNIGVRQFRGSPTLRRLNEGRQLDAALAMELWRKSDLEGERIVIDALVRRRAAEKALFLKPEDGWVPAPTPLLPPKIDYDAMGLIPLSSPVAARAATEGDRAYAERAPEPQAHAAEEPSASAAAAQAVIDRLETILAEPDKPAATTRYEPEETIYKPGPSVTAKTEPKAEPVRPTPAEPVVTRADEVTQSPTQRLNLPPITMLERKPRSGWTGVLLLAFLGVLGILMLGLAGIWGVQPESEEVFGVSPHIAGLCVGIVGIAAAGIATYLLLGRLGANGRTSSRIR